MEFKNSNRQNNRRRQLDIPTRGSSMPTISHSPQQVTPPLKTPIVASSTADSPTDSQEPPAKTSLASKLIAKSGFPAYSSRKKKIIISAFVAIVVSSLVLFVQQTSIANDSNPRALASGNPEYQTILPKNKSIHDLGGWKRISPSQNDPVFAYVDTIDGISISVSQQPLPKSFQDNIDSQVAELAKKFNATTKLNAGATTLYIGTSAKGPQSTIFAKSNLLILIKSQKKIENKSWEKYVGSLD